MLKQILFLALIIPVVSNAEELTGKKPQFEKDTSTVSVNTGNREGATIKRQLDITPENSYNVYQFARHNMLLDNGPAKTTTKKQEERKSIPEAPEDEPESLDEKEDVNKPKVAPMPEKDSYKSYWNMKLGLKTY